MIQLVLVRAQVMETGLYLVLVPARPCQVGAVVGTSQGWELAPGVQAIGAQREKSGLTPSILRVVKGTTADQLRGRGIGFVVLTPKGDTADLAQLLRWVAPEEEQS